MPKSIMVDRCGTCREEACVAIGLCTGRGGRGGGGLYREVGAVGKELGRTFPTSSSRRNSKQTDRIGSEL